MTDRGDPLYGADVGETRTVTRSKTLHGINFEPREFYGTDRQADIRVADLEVVEDDEGNEHNIRITWEADLTKNLPRRWDYCREPRTDEEQATARRKRWLGKVAKAGALMLPFGIATGLALWIMPAFEGVTINGEPMAAPSPVATTAVMLLVAGMAGLLFWAIREGPPSRVGVS